MLAKLTALVAKALSLVSEAKKAAVGLIGFAVLLIATGALTGNVLHVAQGIVALGTVLGIYRASNAAPAVDAPAPVDVPAAPAAAPVVVEVPAAAPVADTTPDAPAQAA